MAKLKDTTITKTISHHLTAEYTDRAGKGAMEIKLDGEYADVLSAWGGAWYHGFLREKPEEGRESIGSTPKEALDLWIRSRGFEESK